MIVRNLAAPVAETLSRGISDVLRMEQYMDFIRNRTFRSTLICHREQQLDRNVDSARVMGLFVAAGVGEDRDAELQTSGHRAYKASSGARFQTNDDLTKAAIPILAAAWPRAVPFEDLLADAARACGGRGDLPPDSPERRRLAGNLLKLYAGNIVELHSIPSCFVTSVSERPRASPIARLQASRSTLVTNLRHESLSVNEVERQVLTLLDGTRGRSQVVEELSKGAAAGKLSLKRGEHPITEPAERTTQLGRMYDQLLPQFGRKALLAG
jgi:methyltransferase-like protein